METMKQLKSLKARLMETKVSEPLIDRRKRQGEYPESEAREHALNPD